MAAICLKMCILVSWLHVLLFTSFVPTPDKAAILHVWTLIATQNCYHTKERQQTANSVNLTFCITFTRCAEVENVKETNKNYLEG